MLNENNCQIVKYFIFLFLVKDTYQFFIILLHTLKVLNNFLPYQLIIPLILIPSA